MNVLRKVRGPAVVAAWAFAPPVLVQQDERGRIDVTVGGSAGVYEFVGRSCTGDIIDVRPVSTRTAGAVVDVRPEGAPVRVSAFGGGIRGSWDAPGGEAEDGVAYFGGVVALETARFGIGGGAVLFTDQPPGSDPQPSAYLRLGPFGDVWLQGDYMAPTATLGTTGVARAAVGFRGEWVGGLVGLSTGRPSVGGEILKDAMDNGGGFLELDVPLGPRWDAVVSGSVFDGEENADWGAGVGVRFRVPR